MTGLCTLSKVNFQILSYLFFLINCRFRLGALAVLMSYNGGCMSLRAAVPKRPLNWCQNLVHNGSLAVGDPSSGKVLLSALIRPRDLCRAC